ncbi:MAG: hypothetical protein N2235_12350 [Fischerella sp.]|nr:hypothetical protein [Fischerella sp.]
MTHKISLRQPRIIINAIAGVITLLAAVTAVRSDNPKAKTLAWVVAVSSAAIGVVNEASSHLYEDNANHQIDALIKPRDRKIAELSGEVEIKRGKLRQAQSANQKLLETIAKLKVELESYQNKTAEEKLFADAILDKFLVKIKELLSAQLEETIEKLKSSIDAKSKQIQDERILNRLNKFKSEIEIRYVNYKVWIAKIERNGNLDFVNDTIEVFNQIHNELASLKVKFIRTLGISERLKFQKILSQEKSKGALFQLVNAHKDNYDDVMAKLESSEQIAAQNEQYIKHIIAELEKAMERLAQKDEEIKALKRPQYWSTPTRDDLWVANIIIGYFEQLGIILDRAHSDYEQWQANLGFHIDRNTRLIRAKDLNEHADKIKQLAQILNTPEFKFDRELGLMTVWVEIAKKPAKEKNPLDECKNSV